MSAQITDKVRQAVSDVFGVELSSITPDSSPQTVEAWDSMGHLNLVLALDNSLASGLYTVQVTAGEQTFTERLVINK